MSSQGSSIGAMPASDGNFLGEETQFASLASDGAGVTTPTPDCTFSSQTQVKAQGSMTLYKSTYEMTQPENQISTLVTTIQPKDTTKSSSTRDRAASILCPKELSFQVDSKVPSFFPEAVIQAGDDTVGDHKNHEAQGGSLKKSWVPAVEQGTVQQFAGPSTYLFRTGSWSGSASLPRGYRRSEGSSRLSSAITARPFGTKQSRVFSLPRLCNVSSLVITDTL